MANNLSSNFTRKVARIFLESFESSRVLSKTVDTQLLSGKFNPASGENVDFKRPHQYRAVETNTGDITAMQNDIIAGKSTGTVQDFITVAVAMDGREEALELDQLEEIVRPAAVECVTRMETNLGSYMIENAGLSWGTTGTGVDDWESVVSANALMQSIGVPQDMGRLYYVMNPFTNASLSGAQTGLTSADQLVRTAWEQAQISMPFAGLRGISSNALSTFTAGAATTRTGTLSATPDGTYVTHKDTMIQTLVLTGLDVSLTDAVRPGDIIEFTGTGADARSRLNVMTRDVAFDATGAPIPWRATVVTGGDTDGAGTVTVTVAAAAINEGATGQYNNVSVALTSGDAFTILGAADTLYQPNLFYHEQAFGLGTVKLPKLFAQDTIATTEDGFSIRVTKYSDGDTNTNKMRFDLLPAFATFNPQFAGHGWKV